MKRIFVSGSFDDLRSGHIRFLEEASKFGDLQVLLWSDKLYRAVEGKDVKFPQAERQYLVESIRYVKSVTVADVDRPALDGSKPDLWVSCEQRDTPARRNFCRENGLAYRVLTKHDCAGLPEPAPAQSASGRKKVLVTGCYDWFHSGHVRFCEEVSQLGDLYVVVGSDANVELLKGPGHPLFKQEERRYVVGSIRYVKQCLISTGSGWMDAEPEVYRLKPDIYAVNEDGDKPEKREFCRAHGLEYAVLKRTPKEGLTRRTSTNLRGF